MDIVIWVHDIFSLPLLYEAEQANLSYFPITGYILSSRNNLSDPSLKHGFI